ncbi:MAG TPA: cytochrome d ubiquinol oxidase subunit II [Legionellales bacterium]|nr:cytochrome d ubiquinol oxidase subunit II [Legionellales bacterium]
MFNLDYESLRVIWWVLLGVLLIGFAIMDGFDMGVAICLPFLGKNDLERRMMINAIGPTWEGNQVWFILGGGAIFAAWPALYALSFSGFYYAMLLVLLALILRPVGFKYRSKLPTQAWRSFWDWALFIGGFVPALIFGVAMGNVLQGVPFHFDITLRAFYTGSFFALLNPFAILCGLLSVSMLVMHGACFLGVKTQDNVQARARTTSLIAALLCIFLLAYGGIWVSHLSTYVMEAPIAHDGPSNPLYKQIGVQTAAWLKNYQNNPKLYAVPGMGFLGALSVILLGNRFKKIAFLSSAMSILGIITSVGVSMFPFILPSSSHPNHSLMIWDSSSSMLTLIIMLIATLIFFPIILSYTAWVYSVLRGPVTRDVIENHRESAY